MSFSHTLCAAALATLSCAAAAQQGAPRRDPADPGAAVPVLAYTSVFHDYRPVVDEKSPPDQCWRAVNIAATGKPAMDAGHSMPPKEQGAKQ